ncbi:hypothetical protein AURDEDRAFT_173768 [Auricularia subglabra TFB-10046 SS5]|nr:hypothetical protein AURDEDRAFT_173768 [Auricularia subglabra TFB-10046 SS5]
MSLNYDVLYIVAHYADARTLVSLCRVSRSLHRSLRPRIVKRLYRQVRIRSWSGLESFHHAITRTGNESLAPFVVSFEESICASHGLLKAHEHFYLAAMSDIIRLSINLEAFSFSGTDSQLVAALASSLHLRHVRLDGSVRLRGIKQPLETLHIARQSAAQDVDICRNLFLFSSSLRSLRMRDCSGPLFQVDSLFRGIRFPSVHTLFGGAFLDMHERLPSMFPALRVLDVSPPYDAREIDKAWPLLQHLRVRVNRTRRHMLLSPGHRVASLNMQCETNSASFSTVLQHLASPHVTSLALSWPRMTEYAWHHCTLALQEYSGLTCLDVSLPAENWILDICALPDAEGTVPPNIAILTMRCPRSARPVSRNLLAQLRTWIPSLRLLRIVPERIAWRWLAGSEGLEPVEWESACELAADASPYWRVSRAPWDEVLKV